MKLLRFLLLIVVVFTLGIPVRAQDARTALIIGCDYQGTGLHLPSPVRDADSLAAKLKEVGFAAKDVTVLKNPNRKQMLEAIDAFGQALLNRGGAGFFYFSGHGAQHEGDNFLIPMGAALGYREDLPTEAVAASRIVTRMEAAGNPVNLLFLDACRTNELPSGRQKSALAKGLTSMGGSGLLIGFAAAANRPSLDSGDGSFYTNALLRHMGTPGLSVLQMLTRVRQDVKKATENQQEPFLYAGLDNDFFFVAESKAAALAAPAPLASVSSAPAQLPGAAAAIARPSPTTPARSAAAAPATGINPSILAVNMTRLFETYPKTKTAEAKVNADRAQAKKELDERVAKARSSTPEIEEWRKAREKEMQDASTQMRAEIVSELNDAIAGTPALSGAAIVLDKSGPSLNGVPVVLHVSPILDRTGHVQKRLAVPEPDAVTSSHDGRGLNIATIDMKKIFDAYYKTKEAEGKINAARNAAKKELEERMAAYSSLVDAIKKLDAQLAGTNLSAKARSAKTSERTTKAAGLGPLEKEIRDFQATREKQLQDQSTRMRTAIVEEITQTFLDGVAEEGKVNLIFDSSGSSFNGVPVVLHLDGVPDWTDAVVTTLNSQKPGSKKVPIGRANGSVSTNALRFAVIDMKRVFEGIPATKTAENEINAARNTAKKELEDRMDRARRLLEEVKAMDAEIASGQLGTAAREQKSRLRQGKAETLKQMDADIRSFQTTREKELQDQSGKLRAEILASINKSINKLLFDGASRASYHVVFDSSGQSLNGVPVVKVQNAVPDLSNEIITALGGTRQ